MTLKRLLLILFFSVSLYAGNAQTIVRDAYKRRQLENMVITRWGNFIPKWYYFLFHNKYRKGEDRRTMLQLLPTMAAAQITGQHSGQQKEDSEQLYKQAVWIHYNREIGPIYHLYYKPLFAKLNAEIDALIMSAQGTDVPPAVLQTFLSEQLRLNEQIVIIRKGFQSQGASNEGYEEIDAELRALQGMIRKYIHHQEILNKYTKL